MSSPESRLDPSPINGAPPEEAFVERSESIVISQNTGTESLRVGITVEDKTRAHGEESPAGGDIALYGIYRDYTKHEDDLINHRLNWNFTIQGFLFVAWAYCVQKVVDVSISLNSASGTLKDPAIKELHLSQARIHSAILLIALLGLGVSALIFLGTVAAQTAVASVRKKWDREHHDRSRGLPGLTGGGSTTAHILGFAAPLVMPIAFIAAWVWILFNSSGYLP